MSTEANVEEKIAHLYSSYKKVPDSLRGLPDAVVLVANIGAAGYSFLNPDSNYAQHYRQLYVWGTGLAALIPSTILFEKLGDLFYRKRIGIVMEIAATEGREVHENIREQVANEIVRANEVIRLGTDKVSPGMFQTELFSFGYWLNRRVKLNENEYEFQIKKDLETFDYLAGYLNYDEITKSEIIRDALIMHKVRLLDEAKRPKTSDKRRIYASRLAVEIDSKLGDFPPLISPDFEGS